MKYIILKYKFYYFILFLTISYSCSKKENTKFVELPDSIKTAHEKFVYEDLYFNLTPNEQMLMHKYESTKEYLKKDKIKNIPDIYKYNFDDIERRDNINIKIRPTYFSKLIIYLDSKKQNELQPAGEFETKLNDDELKSIIIDLKTAEKNYFLTKEISNKVNSFLQLICNREDIKDYMDINKDLKISNEGKRELVDLINEFLKEKGAKEFLDKNFEFSKVENCKFLIFSKIIN